MTTAIIITEDNKEIRVPYNIYQMNKELLKKQYKIKEVLTE